MSKSKLRLTVCGECGVVFMGERGKRACGLCDTSKKNAKPNLHEDDDPRSLIRRVEPLPTARIYYVYFWHKNGETFPFYVGHGSEDRYKAVHSDNSHTGTAWCEKIRRSCKKFKAAIIVDNLTVREARLIENVFIHYFSSIGVLLTNQQGHGNAAGRESAEGEVGEGRESGA